jgi:hypothetical protein
VCRAVRLMGRGGAAPCVRPTLSGTGVSFTAGLERYEGEWADGEPVNYGVHTTSGGTVYFGQWYACRAAANQLLRRAALSVCCVHTVVTAARCERCMPRRPTFSAPSGAGVATSPLGAALACCAAWVSGVQGMCLCAVGCQCSRAVCAGRICGHRCARACAPAGLLAAAADCVQGQRGPGGLRC